MGLITVSAVLFERADGRVLTVRKRGTASYMLPGGKPEPGESALDCALREVDEELGVRLTAADLTPFGVYRTRAANEAGFALAATVFRCGRPVEPRLQAELDDLRWVDPVLAIDDEREAPLNREHVFPALVTTS